MNRSWPFQLSSLKDPSRFEICHLVVLYLRCTLEVQVPLVGTWRVNEKLRVLAIFQLILRAVKNVSCSLDNLLPIAIDTFQASSDSTFYSQTSFSRHFATIHNYDHSSYRQKTFMITYALTRWYRHISSPFFPQIFFCNKLGLSVLESLLYFIQFKMA